MRRRVRQHVNALSVGHLATHAAAIPLPPGRPVEVELGCADASYLFDRHALDPERFYVGVEIRREMVDRANRRAREECPEHLTVVYGNLLVDLENLLPDHSVDLCHINFPDPFFKRSQHKRRFLTPPLVSSLSRILRPGGSLWFQSDVFEVALEALELLELGSPPFRNASGPWRFARTNPFGARSKREKRCEARGLRVWRLLFHRRADVDATSS